MNSKAVFVVCLVLVPCVLGAAKRTKRQFNFGGFRLPSNFQDMLDSAQSLTQHAQELAQQTLHNANAQLTPEQQQQLSQASSQLNNLLNDTNLQGLTDQLNPDIPQSPSQNIDHATFPGMTGDKEQALFKLMSNENYQADLTRLQQKYAGNLGSDSYQQEAKELAEKYLNGGAGLVASLVALVASLVVQGLMFG